MATMIADALEEAEPVLVKQAQDAERRERERPRPLRGRTPPREGARAREGKKQARQAAKDDLRSIVKAWNDAFAIEAFFTELSRPRGNPRGDDERTDLEARIATARGLMGGRDAVDRFLQWTVPEREVADDGDDDDR